MIEVYVSMIYTTYMDNNEKFNNQLRKGFFELAILMMLAKKPMYGYELTKGLKESKVFSIADGAIYPILKRLTANGFIDTYTEEHDGRSRKYYKIKGEGKKLIKEIKGDLEFLYDFFEKFEGDE